MPRTTAVFINTINQSEHDGEMIGTTTSHLEEHRVKTGLRFPLAWLRVFAWMFSVPSDTYVWMVSQIKPQ